MYLIKDLLSDLLDADATLIPEPRDYIYASEIGKPFLDRYLTMSGVPYSNPATGISLQHFYIGKGVEEGFIKPLQICMIPHERSSEIILKRKNCLDIKGKTDLIVEVQDWKEVSNRIDQFVLSEPDKYRQKKKKNLKILVDKWQKVYPNGLKKTVFEVKSINSWALKYHRKTGIANAYPHYVLQLYAYMIALDLEQGHLLFIAKDMGKNSGWIEEVVIQRNQSWEDKFWEDAERFSEHYLNRLQPSPEPILDGDKLNWRVKYSPYYDSHYIPLIKAHLEKIKTNIKLVEKIKKSL